MSHAIKINQFFKWYKQHMKEDIELVKEEKKLPKTAPIRSICKSIEEPVREKEQEDRKNSGICVHSSD